MRLHKYTLEQLAEAIATSTSNRQALEKLNIIPAGGNYQTFKKAIKHFNLDTSHFTGQAHNKGKTFGPKRPLEEYLSNKHPIQSHKLRLRLLREGIFNHECSSCGLSEWNGQPIPLELEHINGNHFDNSLSNLTLLCPNCHAQTSSYRRRKSSQ